MDAVNQAVAAAEARFRLIADNARDVVVQSGADGTVEWASPSVVAALGWTPDSLVGSRLSALVHPDDLPAAAADRDDLSDGHVADGGLEVRLAAADGEWRWMSMRGRVTVDDVGRVVGRVDTLRDIQAQRDAMQALRSSERRYRLLAENAYDVIWTMDLDGTVTYVSPAVERMRGITPEQAMRQTLAEIHPPSSQARVLDYYARLSAAIESGDELPVFHGDQEYYRADGSIMIGELHVVPEVDDDGRVVQLLGVTRDVTDQRRYEAALVRQATVDTLTGLLSRAEGLDRLEHALSHPPRSGDRLAVAFVDLDNFKDINDSLGHAAGDEVLRAVAARLHTCLRHDDLVVRVGGDEILVVLDGVHDLREAVELAERIRTVVAAPVDLPEGEAVTTASIGVTLAEPGESVDAVVARADGAMYRAKATGRDAVVTAA